MNLSRRGVNRADVRYEFALSVVAPSTITCFCRPTGWHGESGAAGAGGHLAVDFFQNDRFIITHHVYRTDDGYAKCVIHLYSTGPPLMLYQTTEDVKVKTRSFKLTHFSYYSDPVFSLLTTLLISTVSFFAFHSGCGISVACFPPNPQSFL